MCSFAAACGSARMTPDKPEPLVAPIDVESDRERRTAVIRIPGIGEARIEPIKNPVTGLDHRAQIRLNTSFEFNVGEMASATFKAHEGDLQMDREKVYGVLCHVSYGPYGIIKDHLLDSAALDSAA